MKTTITIKETKQALANNPKSIAKYITELNDSLKKADRDGNFALAKVLYSVDDTIKQGLLSDWTDFKSAADFAEKLTGIKKARTSQLIKGYSIYLDIKDFIDVNEDDDIDIDPEMIKALNIYTITHMYHLKGLEPYEIHDLFKSGTLTADMSVSDLQKALKASCEDNTDGENDTDGENTENAENEIIIRNEEQAEQLYKDIIEMLGRGETISITLSTL